MAPARASAIPAGIRLSNCVMPGGIVLSCRQVGPADGPRVLLLHGFPEAAFIWDPVMTRLAGRASCLAPNLRGFEHSSAPTGVEAYRARHLVADLVALIGQFGAPVDLLVAHDWGGALAWSLAALHPQCLKRLLIINAPHPATFLRDLQSDAEQQEASAYMNYLCRPDAAARLAENDHARLFALFERMGATDHTRSHGAWLDADLRQRYRETWQLGLEGPLNFYRASPLRPPTAEDDGVMRVQLPAAAVTVNVPTTVLWGEADTALRPRLLEGLDAYVADLQVLRVPHATHWLIHEQPDRVAETIAAMLADGR